MQVNSSSKDRKTRILIFVVAYEAESTLETVLARVPDSVFAHDTEVLVIDDSSRDRTFDVGVRSAKASRHPVTVLYNPENQGYGGNQKLGYQYAIRHGFDIVVLLHGDGQYAPEAIPRLLQPLLDGDAEAVMGSRMLRAGRGAAGRHAALQVRRQQDPHRRAEPAARHALSEFHSGFRAYSRGRPARRFRSATTRTSSTSTPRSSSSFCWRGFRIVEVPIPTYYGDEICRVDGMQLRQGRAADHGRQPAAPVEHSVRPQVRHRRLQRIAHYGLKLGYRSSHTMALDAVPPGARVLDIGCGPGRGAGTRSEGLSSDRCGSVAAGRCRQASRRSLLAGAGAVRRSIRGYDCVLLLDVIEHLRHPERFSTRLRERHSSTQPDGLRSSSPPATSCSASCGCRRCSATSITASAASST